MRRMLVVLAAIVLITSGCFWDQPGFDASGSNNNFTETGIGVNNVASLHTRWSSASSPTPWTAITQSDVGLIDVTDGTTLSALDPATGATVWSRREPSGVTVYGATGYGNNILVTTLDAPINPDGTAGPVTANLEVRDARTGATVSTTPIAPTGSSFQSAPKGSLVTRSGPWVVTEWETLTVLPTGQAFGWGGFQVTNLDDPSQSWRFDGSLVGPNDIADDYSYPVIMGNRLYLEHLHQSFNGTSLDSTSTVVAWNLSGCTNQCAPLFETPPEPSPLQPMIGSHDGRAVYLPTDAGFAAYDPATGAKQWEAMIDGNSSGAVLATTDDAEVLSSKLADGSDRLAVYPNTCAAAPCAPTWTTSLPSGSSVTQGAVANGLIFVGGVASGSGGSLAAYPLDCTDGCQPLFTTPALVSSGPIVSNGQVLYSTANSNSVVALTS